MEKMRYVTLEWPLNRITIAISWIDLGSFVFTRCGHYEKALDYRSGHCIVQSTRILSFFGSIGIIQARTLIRRIHRNEVEQELHVAGLLTYALTTDY